ncbi:MAG: hypothetical protein VB101_01125 [Rhodospirillaceae bacterium]|nr:hypothetical protein [Rhodospirillaceae bacterium]
MNVRELVIKLVLNRSGLKTELDKTKRGLDDAGQGGRKAGEQIKQGADNASGGVRQLVGVLGKTVALLGGLAMAKSAVSNYLELAASIDRTSASLGMSVERFQQWRGVAELAGTEGDEIGNTFRDMSDYITDALKFDSGPLKEISKEIGVRLTDASGKARDTEAVFLDLADAFNKLPAQQAAGYGMQLSFDPAIIALLQKGSAEIEVLLAKQKELGLLTKADTEAAVKARAAIGYLGKSIESIVGVLVRAALPALQWLAERLTAVAVWVRQNEGFILAFFGAFAVLLTARLLPALYRVAAANLAAWLPLLLAVAVIGLLAGAIGLLIDDFLAWSEGGQSAFGGLWQAASEAFAVIRDGVAALWAYIGPIWEAFKTLWAGVWTAIKGIFKGDAAQIQAGFGQMLDGALGMLGGWAGAIRAMLVALFDWILGLFASLGNLIQDKVTAAAGDALATVKGFFGFGGAPSPPPAPSAGMSPSVANRQSNVNAETHIGEIKIETQATDAKGIARDLGQELRSEPLQAEYAMGY